MTKDELTAKGFVETSPGVWVKRGDGAPVISSVIMTAPVTRERDLHDQIEAYLRERGYLYRHDRMDRATTGQVGWPDFTIFMPHKRVLFLECKAKGKKATTAQLSTIAHSKKFGFTAKIVDNFASTKLLIENENN